jgi:hypothetical protein
VSFDKNSSFLNASGFSCRILALSQSFSNISTCLFR